MQRTHPHTGSTPPWLTNTSCIHTIAPARGSGRRTGCTIVVSRYHHKVASLDLITRRDEAPTSVGSCPLFDDNDEEEENSQRRVRHVLRKLYRRECPKFTCYGDGSIRARTRTREIWTSRDDVGYVCSLARKENGTERNGAKSGAHARARTRFQWARLTARGRMLGGRTDGRTDSRTESKTTELLRTDWTKVGLDTLGRIGAYGQRRSRPRGRWEGMTGG